MSDIVSDYLACWNEIDPQARRALIEKLFAADASYVDPMAEVHGHEAIDTLIAAVQQQFPGFVFSPHGPTDTHHNQSSFTWALGPEGTDPPVVGFDVVVTAPDGRIETVLGFLDRVPS